MIGILPCAGKAERLHGIPKWLLPIPDSYLLKWHVEGMKLAGCEWVCIGCNQDNCDLIGEYVGSGVSIYSAQWHDTMSQTTLSFRAESGYKAYEDENVLFGMPDTYWLNNRAYQTLAGDLREADIAVGYFAVSPGQHQQLGMVELGMVEISDLRILKVIDKPRETDLTFCWGALAWKPVFWQYIHPEDAHVGFAVQRAIEAGLHVRGIPLGNAYFDCGTIEGYYNMLKAVMK